MAAAAFRPAADSQTMTADQTINGANLPLSVGQEFFVSDNRERRGLIADGDHLGLETTPVFSAGSRPPPIPGDARGCVAFAEEVD